MKLLREQAVALLARRDYSQYELRQKLISRGCSTKEIDEVLEDLATQGLQSDTRFTEMFVHHRMNAGYGPQRITLELQQKGVSKEIIALFLSNNTHMWETSMKLVWEKKFKGQKPCDSREYARQSRFLVQRGFSPELVRDFLT